MKSLTTQWTGIRPLIMSNPQTVQLSNPFAIEARKLQTATKNARKKQDENKLLELENSQIRNDWESSAYWDDEEKKFFVPDTILMASIRGGAAAAKKGKDIERAVIITETQAYLDTKHFKSLDAAFEDKTFRLEGPCKIPPKTGALIWKARCMIPTGWKIKFQVEYDEDIVATKSLTDAMELAGRLVGLGSWRPKFGRFITEVIS